MSGFNGNPRAGADIPIEPAYDVVVVGGGAAGLTAAACAAVDGLNVLLVDKAERIGGTTAISGGMVWAPANRFAEEAGMRDSLEAATRYLHATVPDGADDPLLATFVHSAGPAIDFLRAHIGLELQPVLRYPDYYQAAAGATLGGRVLEARPFDIRQLGRHRDLLAPPLPEMTLFGGMMVDRADLPAFRKPLSSWRNMVRIASLGARHLLDRLTIGRGGRLVLGNALVARLLDRCLAAGVTISTSTNLIGIVTEGARVTDVELERRGHRLIINARRGVILSGGGFSHDPAMRAHYLPVEAGIASAAQPVDAGDTIRAALSAGGRMRSMMGDNALWVPLSRFTRRDGSAARFPHTVTDRGKPGVIAVTSEGKRFVNEAMNYHHFCQALLAVTPKGQKARAFLICDRNFLRRYGLGAAKPFGIGRRSMLANGYLVEAQSISELARKLSIDPHQLAVTVARTNADAVLGEDTIFGRGSDEYQRHFGDPDCKPNPCLAPIASGPFYGIEVVISDLGTAAGLDVDNDGRVLRHGGQTFANLHACGNDMRSVMGGAYPGPGITLGPALVFAWRAARALSGER
ncbi:FAD-dependent oxidoreductase [Chelativorans sp. ZYF759]|uniref:FAD-dependent oxidoreductase n=1 Tax=Chelativorans sp. ZYF759 TaxID=2692213 RepID=UPI00145E9DC0|nr:FAD-dependent oxidoreductase [Chelativorans sp. ZYF759]NMG41831.1 FAD-dependent oxidoreductase [Chelativorans sp. ZYF759]